MVVTSDATFLLCVTSVTTRIAIIIRTVPTAATIAMMLFVRARLSIQRNGLFQSSMTNSLRTYRLLFCEAVAESYVKACAGGS